MLEVCWSLDRLEDLGSNRLRISLRLRRRLWVVSMEVLKVICAPIVLEYDTERMTIQSQSISAEVCRVSEEISSTVDF